MCGGCLLGARTAALTVSVIAIAIVPAPAAQIAIAAQLECKIQAGIGTGIGTVVELEEQEAHLPIGERAPRERVAWAGGGGWAHSRGYWVSVKGARDVQCIRSDAHR